MSKTCSSSAPLGTNVGQQCEESVTILYVLSKDSFEFQNASEAKDLTKWEEAIDNRDLVPLFEIYEFANENEEATFFEARNYKKETKKAVKKTTSSAFLSVCAHKVLSSYNDSEYVNVFEVTDDGKIIGILDSNNGAFRGQLLSDFNVGIRENPTEDAPAKTKISLTYNDYKEFEREGMVLLPDFDPVTDLEGLLQLRITVTSTDATSLDVIVSTFCENDMVEGLSLGDFEIKDETGATVVITALVEASAGEYKLTASNLTTGTIMVVDGTIFNSNKTTSYETSF